MKDSTFSFSLKYNLDETDVRKYDESMQCGNLSLASFAFHEIRRKVRIDNTTDSFQQFAHRFAPIKKELYEMFGSVDKLREEADRATMGERNIMEVARKRIEAEEEAERIRLQVFQDMSDSRLDSEYFKAVGENDELHMRDLVNEAARRNGYISGAEFRMAHGAPSYDESGIDKSMVDVANNKDQIRDSLNELLRRDRDKSKDESAVVIDESLTAIGNGESPTVTIYRAVPKSLKEGNVRSGDWVTLSESYAKLHGEHTLSGDYRIMKDEVPAENLYWDGNDINEWGYDDRSDYRYKNTKNNRKLNDLITRDDKGDVIPLSKRFNSRQNDIRYRFIGTEETTNLARTGKTTFRMSEDIGREDQVFLSKSFSESKLCDFIFAIESLAKSIHAPVGIIHSVDELPDSVVRCNIKAGLNIKGWFNPETKALTVYLPNVTSVEDAQRTVFHEAVGHYGLRRMFGNHLDIFLDNVYNNASSEIQGKILYATHGDLEKRLVATEEYLAKLAERGFRNPLEISLWEKTKFAFIDMLHHAGVNLGFKLRDNDLRSILWKSCQNLCNRETSNNVTVEIQEGIKQNPIDSEEIAIKTVDKPNEVTLMLDNEFREAIDKTDFPSLIQLKEQGYQPSKEVLQSLAVSFSVNSLVAVQKIFGLNSMGDSLAEVEALQNWLCDRTVSSPFMSIQNKLSIDL